MINRNSLECVSRPPLFPPPGVRSDRGRTHSFKTCRTCQVSKPVNEFYWVGPNSDSYTCRCKICHKKNARVWVMEHQEVARARARTWAKMNPERHQLNGKIWRKAQKKKKQVLARKTCSEAARAVWIKRKARLEAKREYERAWIKLNRGKKCAYSARHRARRETAAGAQYTTAEHIRLRWEMFGGKCWICHKRATAIDHVKPLSKGGAHLPCNLRPICGRCNSRKNSKWPRSSVDRGTLTLLREGGR